MTTIKRPMLASAVTPEQLEILNWPILVSPKIDGIRCLIHPELGPVTRKFKPVPNVHIREILSYHGFTYLDGEIVTYDIHGNPDDFNQVQSKVMSHDGEPNFHFNVFDCFANPQQPYEERLSQAETQCRRLDAQSGILEFIDHLYSTSPENFKGLAEDYMAIGFEGAMIRATDGPYKEGRSTLKQGWLLKYKPTADAEATVIGVEPLFTNENPQERDELGYAKRSSKIAQMKEQNTLGALIVHTEQWGEFRIGSGFDASTRYEIWANQSKYVGRTITFKYQEVGMQDKPRFPIFKGFRPEMEQ